MSEQLKVAANKREFINNRIETTSKLNKTAAKNHGNNN